MPRGKTAANYPRQLIYTFAATSDITGNHVSTLFRMAKTGRLETVETPFGRRITRSEVQRLSGQKRDDPDDEGVPKQAKIRKAVEQPIEQHIIHDGEDDGETEAGTPPTGHHEPA